MAGTSDVVVRFIADTSRIKQGVAEVEGTGSKLKSWAMGVGAAFGAAFAVQQLKEMTDAAAEFADTVGASQVIFGKQADSVRAWVDSNAAAFLMSKGQAMEAANTFATFGKAAGLTGTDLSGFSTKLTGLAGDLASFRGGTTEEAIQAIGAALRGESEPIRKYGVMLDDATLRARAFAMGISDGTSVLTPAQKTLAAQAEILAQTSDAQGDAARTADSAANQQRRMAAEVANAKVAIGTALLPVLQALLPILTKMAKFLGENADVLVPLAGVIAAVTVAQWAWNAAMSANPLGAIVLGIAAVIAIIVLAIKHWDDIKAAAGAALDFILGAVQTVWNWIKDNWPLLLAILTGPFGIAIYAIVHFKDQILEAIQFVIDWIRDHWPLLLAIITGPFGIAVYLIVNNFETIKNIARGAIDFVRGVFDDLVGYFRGLPGQVADALAGLFEIIVAPFRGAVQEAKNLWNGFARAFNGISISIPSVDTHLPGVGTIGGGTLDFPNLPTLDAGAIVSGPTLALLAMNRRPEAVVPLPRGGLGGITNTYQINVTVPQNVDPAQTGRTIVDLIRSYERANGRRWREGVGA